MDSMINEGGENDQIQRESGQDETPKTTSDWLNELKNGHLSIKNGKVNIIVKGQSVLTKDGKIKLKKIYEILREKKINLLEIDALNLNGKIDTFYLVNDDNDDKIDLFTYSTNVYDGKIDIEKLTNSKNGKINLLLLNGIYDDAGQLNFAKVCFGANSFKINYNIIDLDKYFYNGKLILSKIKNINLNSNVNIFDFDQCLSDGKIDQAKLCNSVSDDSINIFEYTTNFSNNRIEIFDFTNSIDGKVDLFKFNGITDSDSRVDFARLSYSRHTRKEICSHINIGKFFDGGKFILSKIKISSDRGRINLFDFTPCLTNGKIDQSKICNSESDDSIDICKYTVNHLNGLIDISKFTNGQNAAIDLLKFTGIKDENGQVDYTKIYDDSKTIIRSQDILF